MSITHSTDRKPEHGPHQIHFRLNDRDFQEIHHIAEVQGEHIAALMRRLVRVYLRQYRQALNAPSARGIDQPVESGSEAAEASRAMRQRGRGRRL
jgi:hypothetical protein